MRPKVVLLILIAAFVLVGVMAALKGISGRQTAGSGGESAGSNVVASTAASPAGAATNGTAGVGVANPPQISPELRAELIAKEQDQIQQLLAQADGTNNAAIITALIGKVENPEPEIRKAALAAFVNLNDTNAIQPLKEASDRAKDPRVKVAILDTVDYLNLPDAMPAVQPPESMSNTPVVIPKNLRMNPAFLHTNTSHLNMPAK